ncbi:MAG: helix-turn-helix transcriptional regulator, partial [Planctomycetota bacterium]
MADDNNYLALIDQIYGAALEPDRWPTLLEEVSGIMNATGALLTHRDFELVHHSAVASYNLDPAAFIDYGQYFIKQDVWAHYAANEPVGSVFTSETIIPDEELLRHEFYNDFLRKADIRHSCGLVLEQSEKAFCTLGLYRSHRQEDFQKDEIETASLILPHLSRSVQMYGKFARLENLSSGLLHAFELSRDAVFLLDGSCRIEHSNVRAASLLERRDGFSGDQRRLRAHDAVANDKLQAIVSHVAVSHYSDFPNAGEHLIVRRPDGRRPFQLLIAPLVSRAILEQVTTERSAAKCVVVVTDLEALPVPSESVLRDLYQLTNAESRLAARLGAGETLSKAAEVLGITRETARTVLKRIFQKTDTHRQAELVRLIASSSK